MGFGAGLLLKSLLILLTFLNKKDIVKERLT